MVCWASLLHSSCSRERMLSFDPTHIPRLTQQFAFFYNSYHHYSHTLSYSLITTPKDISDAFNRAANLIQETLPNIPLIHNTPTVSSIPTPPSLPSVTEAQLCSLVVWLRRWWVPLSHLARLTGHSLFTHSTHSSCSSTTSTLFPFYPSNPLYTT